MTTTPAESEGKAPAPDERPYDVVLWGATGFTGRFVAEHLARQAGDGLRWAIGGRNPDKLARVREHLAGIEPRAADIPILTGDSHDAASLDALCRQTRVVCAAVGPFAQHGGELVAACVRQGTHYCDVTGEPHFILQTLEAHHEAARAKGVRLVHCCGIDSVPSDLGCFMLHDHAREQNRALGQVKCIVTEWRGGYSGGTYDSMFKLWRLAARDKALRQTLMHPYGLNPEDQRSGPDGPDVARASRDREASTWTGLFLMAPLNARIVRRTNHLLGGAYGDQFSYSEMRGYGSGAGGWWRATSRGMGWTSFMVFGLIPPTRWLLKRFVPKPGRGPSEKKLARGGFKLDLYATMLNSGGAPKQVLGRMQSDIDFYRATGLMAAESALCLAQDQAELPDLAGVLTPAAALGRPLLERLRRAGMTFSVEPATAG